LAPRGEEEGAGIRWSTIVRPVLVSVAYALGTPVLAILARRAVRSGKIRLGLGIKRRAGKLLKVRRTHVNLFIIIITLMAFVATTHLAGTSELFGAYLAGAFLGYVFEGESTFEDGSGHDSNPADEVNNAILITFNSHIARTLLGPLLSPLFFASIGASIPVNQFFTIYLPGTQGLDGSVGMVRSHRVVWRGIVYSLLMILGKAVTGVWVFLFWKQIKPQEAGNASESTATVESAKPNEKVVATPVIEEDSHGSSLELAPPQDPNPLSSSLPSRASIALLLGLAMVARGEIALIVAQLARPLLILSDSASGTDSEEPFVIVMWAVMLTTFGGALGVGWVIRATKDRDWCAS
jgi:Kef-type K+ transport system membrane component KefB